jgi:V8-like Glu-specific endopeptidase
MKRTFYLFIVITLLFGAISSQDVLAQTKKNIPLGTCFALTSDGYLGTAAHVILDDYGRAKPDILIRGIQGNPNKTYSAEVVSWDVEADAALLKIDDPGFFTLGSVPYKINANKLSLGASIFILGYPSRATFGDNLKLASGSVSSTSAVDYHFFQMETSIYPGFSGSPVFNSNGEVIGIVYAYYEGTTASFASKIEYLQKVMNNNGVVQKTPDITLQGKLREEQIENIESFIYCVEQKNVGPEVVNLNNGYKKCDYKRLEFQFPGTCDFSYEYEHLLGILSVTTMTVSNDDIFYMFMYFDSMEEEINDDVAVSLLSSLKYDLTFMFGEAFEAGEIYSSFIKSYSCKSVDVFGSEYDYYIGDVRTVFGEFAIIKQPMLMAIFKMATSESLLKYGEIVSIENSIKIK